MRFTENGPSIPDRLLVERDQGNVVFLCGAGVSYPAGFPDFKKLTEFVLDDLGVPAEDNSRQMFDRWSLPDADTSSAPSFDQIFNEIYQNYPSGEVDFRISKRLKTKPKTNKKYHEAILRLAMGPDNKYRLVTTNFDLMFEYASSNKIESHIAPKLPDLANTNVFSGLVYLHGRLNSRKKPSDGRHGYIISGSDFGRAYLAEGWATQFFRDLLQNYTVVLLGYTANDPPVQYLLQGLNARSQSNQRQIYAFDSGDQSDVDAKWRGSGVIPIAYQKTSNKHAELWDTIFAWAERAANPTIWTKNVLALASQSPNKLRPFERGQVVSFLQTDEGAKIFSEASVKPPAEWLCVFDSNLRLKDKALSYSGKDEFDPWKEYHLDDDPVIDDQMMVSSHLLLVIY